MSNTKTPRSIKRLIENAKKGDMKSKFQLAEYYSNGRFVDEDQEKAIRLYNDVLNISENFNLQISNVTLNNFKQFDYLSINLDKHLTILVGNNGSGKTTIIESVSKSLSWLIAKFKSENSSGSHIDEKEINVNCDAGNCSVATTFKLDENLDFSLNLSRSKVGSHKRSHNELEDISLLGEIYRYTNENLDGKNLPTIAYYSVLRSAELEPKDFNSAERIANKKSWSKLDGYDNALDGKCNFGTFLGWFIRYSNIYEQEIKNKEPINDKAEKLKSDIAAYQNAIDDLTSSDTISNSYANSIEVFKSLISDRVLALETLNREISVNLESKSKLIEFVQKAICNFIPEITNIRVHHTEAGVDLLVDKHNVTLSVSQLSHGERTLMAMVGDIARRMVLLNPSRDNPLDGDGVLIIDEIDMHLHPEWQQRVVNNLTNTFRNIQFIITTHSPQVLSSVSRKNVKMLERNSFEEFIAATPSIETYGHSNADVMQGVMRVSPTPTLATKDEELLNEYKKLIEQGDLSSKRLPELRAMLVDIFGSEHRELIRLEMVKRRREALE